MRNSGKLVLSIVFVYITWSVETVVSQECRSYNRQVGHCVSILTCPPLLRILRMSPTVQELRQLQRLTCGFDGSDPKVCCPTNSIFPPLESTSDRISGSPSDTESSSPMTPVPSTTKTASTETPLSDIASDLTRPDLKSHPKFNLIPTLKECSEVFVTGDRVVGGKEVAHGTYPWMARVGYQHSVTKKLTYYCGGNIINNRYILTAAHCTEGLEEYTPKEVRLGENDSSQESNCNAEYNLCSKAEDFQIEKIISHPGYSTITKQNDISLIRVNRNISFDSYFIQPLCLPFDKEYAIENFTLPLGVDGTKAVVAGWGRTVANKNKGSDKLLEVTLPVKTNKECQSIFSRRVTISSKQICAGGETGMDSCGGDSGGPLVGFKTVNNETRRTKFFQVGIVSFGPVNCGVGGLPGVYTRVSHYLDWILDTIEP